MYDKMNRKMPEADSGADRPTRGGTIFEENNLFGDGGASAARSVDTGFRCRRFDNLQFNQIQDSEKENVRTRDRDHDPGACSGSF